MVDAVVRKTCQFDFDEVSELSVKLSQMIGMAKAQRNSGVLVRTDEEIETLEECWRILREMVG